GHARTGGRGCSPGLPGEQAVPPAPARHPGERALLDERRAGRAVLSALRRLRDVGAPARAGVSELPVAVARAGRGLRAGAAPHLDGEPPSLDPGLRPAVRDRDRRDRGAAGPAHHHQPRELHARGAAPGPRGARAVRGARGRDPPPALRAGAAVREILERKAVISGIGQSEIGRRLGRDPLALTVDACLAAIEDAGLTRDDIDGVATYPGAMAGGAAPGFSGAGVTEVQEALRLRLDWWTGGPETSGQLGSVITAAAAIAAGYARNVLCFRSVWESSAQGRGPRARIGMAGGGRGGPPHATGMLQWAVSCGDASLDCW